MSYYFLITIDVEDWFQVENFKQYIPYDSWSSYELRVEKNTYRILDLFDSIERKKTEGRIQKKVSNNRTQVFSIQYPDKRQESIEEGQYEKVRGTFFVLGWLAERLPHLVREIHSRGHEVASHGYRHNLCNQESSEDLKTDLSDSKKCLEDIIGVPVYGYRAPSFSINNDTLKIIEECGYLYDSSFNSFGMHGRYGKAHLSKNMKNGIAVKISDTFYELPVGNLKFACQEFPWGGGGYFRLIPLPLFRLGIKSILKEKGAYLFYMHPWEIDPEQPKVNQASMFYKFRHYVNLENTFPKLSKLIENFAHCNFITCSQHLNEAGKGAR